MTPADSLGWAWVGHLLDGGRTPWAQFDGAPAAPRLGVFPGAAQLELARRVNEAGARPTVVRRILTTGAPFRGQQEFLVRGVAEVRDYGPVPVDPAEVPRQELVRVGVGALAEELASRVPPPARPRRPRPWDRFRGSGVLALPLAPVDHLLYDAWAARARRGRVLAWRRWTVRLARTDRVPEPLQFERRAQRWLATGFRRRVEVTPEASGRPVAADSVELVRQVHMLLGGLLAPDERDRLAQQLLSPWLGQRIGDRRLRLPDEVRAWATTLGERIAEDVRRAGYPVRGNLATLTQLDTAAPQRPPLDDVLAATVHVLGKGWENES